jgi:NhaA family Na+:H+ antiporter
MERTRRERWRAAPEAIAGYLRTETIGGGIMLAATVLALLLANLPATGPAYRQVRDTVFGPHVLHLDLTVGDWAADGLLALFFFVAGLELKRELVVGELRRPRAALLPVCAALGGMVAPALVALAVAAGTGNAHRIWPVPVATDIAFALAVLAVTASRLPGSLRVFLLSLAIVDDLGAILLILLLFTGTPDLPALGVAAVLLVLYYVCQRLRVRAWLLYAPLVLAVWVSVHASGIHATVAGVLLGLLTRVRRADGEDSSPGERLEHRFQPLSAGVAVPVFAFFAAGVPLSAGALRHFGPDRLAWAVVAGLVVGKFIGVFGGTALAVRLRVGVLPAGLRYRDIAAVSVLAGCGFTVSLLIAELSFEGRAAEVDTVKLAVLVGSLLSGLVAAVLLRLRVRAYS